MKHQIEIKQIKAQDTWEMRHRIMWPHMPFDFVKLPLDEEGTHFGLFKNDILVSIVSLFFADDKAQFRKLATEPSEQGNGFGSELLTHVFEFAEQKRASAIWCNARQNKSDFYKRFGMIATEETYTKGGIDFVVMEKEF